MSRYTFSELVAGGTTTDGNYYTYRGRSVWIPGPDSGGAARAISPTTSGLQHIIIWELGQDRAPDDASRSTIRHRCCGRL